MHVRVLSVLVRQDKNLNANRKPRSPRLVLALIKFLSKNETDDSQARRNSRTATKDEMLAKGSRIRTEANKNKSLASE